MKWLLWKDYRQNRLVVFAGLFFLLAPYAIGLWDGRAMIYERARAPEGRLIEIFAIASVWSLAISQVTFALIGGNAIAGERVDRSAEFLYAMPITRRKLLASKIVVALAIAAVPWLIDAPVFWYLANVGALARGRLEVGEIFAVIATTGLIFFSVAWVFSSFIASPTLAVCGGLVTPLIPIVPEQLGLPVPFPATRLWYCTICLTLALVCFGVGTWHYLRRVEP